MLYQVVNDYGLAEPSLSLASDYCQLVCDNVGTTSTKAKVKANKPLPWKASEPQQVYEPRSKQSTAQPRISATTKPTEYVMGPDEIPNLEKLPALGVNVGRGMKPFFGAEPIRRRLRIASDGLPPDFVLSKQQPIPLILVQFSIIYLHSALLNASNTYMYSCLSCIAYPSYFIPMYYILFMCTVRYTACTHILSEMGFILIDAVSKSVSAFRQNLSPLYIN